MGKWSEDRGQERVERTEAKGMREWRAEELPEPSLCPHPTPMMAKKVKGTPACGLGFCHGAPPSPRDP